MRRADRLFRLVNILQRENGPITAQEIATELEISVRTVYRDVADLVGSGVPVDGEAGIGYRLGPDYNLPPLMLTDEEVEAVVFGMAVAQEWGDPSLSKAAQTLKDKINASLSPQLREILAETRILVPRDGRHPKAEISHPDIRRAIRLRQVTTFDYTDGKSRDSQRTVWPLGLVFFGTVWMLGAWCEMREDYRMFRLDRMRNMHPTDRRFPKRKNRSLEDFMTREWYAGPHASTC